MSTNAQSALSSAASFFSGFSPTERDVRAFVGGYVPNVAVTNMASQFKMWLDAQDAAEKTARTINDKGTLEQRIEKLEAAQ